MQHFTLGRTGLEISRTGWSFSDMMLLVSTHMPFS